MTPARYQEIAADIRNAIASGDFPPGAQLPSENVLMDDYGVARNTAREALRVLQDEGLAIARQGSGTFVAARKTIANTTPRELLADARELLAEALELINVAATKVDPDGPHDDVWTEAFNSRNAVGWALAAIDRIPKDPA